MNFFKRILWVLWAGFMVPVLLPWAIAPVPAVAAQGPMLRIEAIPGVDQLVDIETRVRHTTVIVLPEGENILDFVVGDSEYWHLTGAANVAFLKPIATGVETNVALICESGRIYSFLASEGGEPHLVVRIEPPPEDATLISAWNPTHPPSLRVPKSPPIRSWRNRPGRPRATPRWRPTHWPRRHAPRPKPQWRTFGRIIPRGCILFTASRIALSIPPSMSKPCGTTASSPISAHTPGITGPV